MSLYVCDMVRLYRLTKHFLSTCQSVNNLKLNDIIVIQFEAKLSLPASFLLFSFMCDKILDGHEF
jgi:hypothetical protein